MHSEDINPLKIDMKQLFKCEAEALPFCVSLQVEEQWTAQDLVSDALDQFNLYLSRTEVNSQYRLDEDPKRLEINYALSIADSRGMPESESDSVPLSQKL